MAEIDPVTLYRLLALRVDVFVVEQACPYPELDGRDLEPTARLIWAERDGTPIATLRLLLDAGRAARIGRVATATSARSGGVAARLMERALDLAELLAPGRDVVLDAQAPARRLVRPVRLRPRRRRFEEDGIATRPDAPPGRAVRMKLSHDTSYSA